MKNEILYRCLETKHYLCTIIQNKMGINKLKVVLTEEAQAFLDAQPFKAQQKIYYNIFNVEEGVMKVDIFKKTGKYRDMGVSNSLQWYMLQAFLLLGY